MIVGRVAQFSRIAARSVLAPSLSSACDVAQFCHVTLPFSFSLTPKPLTPLPSSPCPNPTMPSPIHHPAEPRPTTSILHELDLPFQESFCMPSPCCIPQAPTAPPPAMLTQGRSLHLHACFCCASCSYGWLPQQQPAHGSFFLPVIHRSTSRLRSAVASTEMQAPWGGLLAGGPSTAAALRLTLPPGAAEGCMRVFSCQCRRPVRMHSLLLTPELHHPKHIGRVNLQQCVLGGGVCTTGAKRCTLDSMA